VAIEVDPGSWTGKASFFLEEGKRKEKQTGGFWAEQLGA